ncbi:hypothetical protein CA267_015980 [Alteromonas pelagimontana]|uniref:Uncharacterized protein n=1 Tax=Alteromonas pelagimontana TaxID=1858656 RepID=A0A6M4MG36_9ALTE|nr:hypothetical protein [Alteromonas pelagimontana]QJR82141.1 hypothetical protein CA267_015980 [Alteromonas pelagimontana]
MSFRLLRISAIAICLSIFPLINHAFAQDSEKQESHFNYNKNDEAGLEWFIRRYKDNDPAGLVNEAELLLAELKKARMKLAEEQHAKAVEKNFLSISSSKEAKEFLSDPRNSTRKDLLAKARGLLSKLKLEEANRELQQLNSITDYQSFITNHSSNEFKELRAIAQHKILSIKTQAQMAEYESLETISDYMFFIRKYEQSDHNGFIAQTKAKVAALRDRTVQFREQLEEGDDSHCGLVVLVKDKVVQIETMIGLKYIKREQVFPHGFEECTFVNNIYQSPAA